VISESSEPNWDELFREGGWPTEPDPWLVERASALPPGKAVDLGSGPGRNAIWLAKQGWAVTAVDASGVALEMLRERAKGEDAEVETVQSDILEAPLMSNSFDLVVLSYIHMPRPLLAKVIEKAASLLSDRGYLYVCGHALEDLGKAGPPDPERLFTVDRIESLMGGLALEYLGLRERVAGDGAVLHDVVAWATRPPAKALA
jgi:SAM-dependent methyltransferase